MTLTDNAPVYVNIHATVPETVKAFQHLSVDDRLGLLWFLHRDMRDAVTSPVPDSVGRIKLSGTLAYQVATLPKLEQLRVMRDLVSGANTPFTRSYGCLSSNSKLAFWYQSANWMGENDTIAVPADYQLSQRAHAVFKQVVKLEFNQKIAFLRLVLGRMGINPLIA